jgi:RNA polymerase sigma-70 factor (ECF subfamily)
MTSRPVVFLTAYRTEPARLLMLVRRMASNDRDAFTRLYDALLPDVTAIVRPRRDDPADADDVIAATFVEAWQSADLHTKPGTDVAAWIDEIAQRRADEPDDLCGTSYPSSSDYPPGTELGALLEDRSPGRHPSVRRR